MAGVIHILQREVAAVVAGHGGHLCAQSRVLVSPDEKNWQGGDLRVDASFWRGLQSCPVVVDRASKCS